MAVHEQGRNWVRMLKNIRINGIGAVQKGDTVDVPSSELKQLLRRGDAEILRGGSKAARKAGAQAEKQREAAERAEAERIEAEAKAAQEAQADEEAQADGE